jgi:hypothetical protein
MPLLENLNIATVDATVAVEVGGGDFILHKQPTHDWPLLVFA